MKPPIRLLLIDDDAEDARMTQDLLAKNGHVEFVVRWAQSHEQAMKELESNPDVCLVDFRLGAHSGLELIEEAIVAGYRGPMILLTGRGGYDVDVEAMNKGAADYLVKGQISPELLERVIRYSIERKGAEAALRACEARYRRIVETTNQGVWMVDLEGRTTFMNMRMASMLGYQRSEVAGLPVLQFVDPGWREAAVKDMRLSLAGKVQIETKLLRKDGSAVWALLETAPIFGDSGLEGSFAMVMDVTEKKRGQAEYLALEAQLRQAQKMEAVGRLAGGIAHDFNNLLSVILGYGEMILQDLRPGDPMRDEVKEIHKAGTRAADLTRQLLMFSRQQVVEPRVLDLNDVLLGMDKMLRRLVGDDIALTSIPGKSLGRVRADAGSIDQVIMNLVVNACDAMPAGGKLTMETANVVLDDEFAKSHLGAKAGPCVMLSISDTGTGMDKAVQARIFDPFFTTKPKGEGTGLGLSTVFGIVQQSGGTIWVYSEPGLGATFKIYLPRVDAIPDEALPARRPAALRGSETILLVEDQDQVRDVARGILRRHGYLILEASNAGEALLLCEKHEGLIHLLVTDVVMPGMSGPELAKRLAPLRPAMKVLYMSGYTDDAAVRHGVIEATFAYLQKPITVETLTKKVRDVLDTIVIPPPGPPEALPGQLSELKS